MLYSVSDGMAPYAKCDVINSIIPQHNDHEPSK